MVASILRLKEGRRTPPRINGLHVTQSRGLGAAVREGGKEGGAVRAAEAEAWRGPC